MRSGVIKKIGCLCVFLIILALIILLIGYFVFDVFGLGKKKLSDAEWIEQQTGITIPENAQIIYRQEDDHGFAPGRPRRYYVFKFEEEPSEWLEENEFSARADEDFETVFRYVNSSIEPGEEGYIPEEYRPGFEKPYYRLNAPNAYYFAYQPDSLMLMVYAVPW